MALEEHATGGKEKHWMCWAPAVGKLLRQAQFSEYSAELPSSQLDTQLPSVQGEEGKHF